MIKNNNNVSKVFCLGLALSCLNIMPIGCSKKVKLEAEKTLSYSDKVLEVEQTHQKQDNNSRPNIVWLVADHFALKQMQYGGYDSMLKTYQRIAAEGISFTQAYSVCPLCSPARASMVTGLYPHTHGITQNGELSVRRGLELDTKLFNHYLQQAGYQAGYFGKWHIGGGNITQFGFEGWSMLGYGNAYRSKEYAQYLQTHGLPQPEVEVEWNLDRTNPRRLQLMKVESQVKPGKNGFRSHSAGKMLTPAETHQEFFVSNLACEWLKQHIQDDEPFVLRVDVWGPHQPYFVAKPYAGMIDPGTIPEYPNFTNDFSDRPKYHQDFRSERRTKSRMTTWEEWQPVVARCYEHVIQADAALGRVLDALDSLGLSGNTIVIYTADHGDAIATNGGLFDKGAMMSEETMLIPMVIRWPGSPSTGEKSNAFVTNMDLVPTVLEMAGVKIPDEMHGKSIVELLKNPETDSWRDDLMCEHHGHGEYVFQRFLRYKNYKYVAHLGDIDELYDLAKDPFETKNLINDASMQEVLKDMRKRLSGNMLKYQDTSKEAKALLDKMEGSKGKTTN